MSYAEAAASGPKQSPEEARAPQPPQLEQHEPEASSSSFNGLDSPHISSVPSDFGVQSVTTEQLDQEQAPPATAAEPKADKKTKRNAAAEKAKEGAKEYRDNTDNPVVIGNTLLVGLGAAVLGFGAYQKHAKGELTWKVAGLWAGAVAGLAFVDFHLSRWLFKNKFPPK